MRTRLFRWFVLGFGAGMSAFVLLWLGLHLVAAQPPGRPSVTLQRPEDPVIVIGADLPGLSGVPVNELVVYSFDGEWQPIPFQIDERTNDITATYTLSDDGVLDDNDELVFMAKDAGQMAPADEWPVDNEARQNPRYQLTAGDPLNPGDTGWAYLFRSTTLPTNPDTYVTWNESLQTATAVSYTASFSPQIFVGLSNLTINGNGIDILDRQKIRVRTFLGTVNEEDLATQVTSTVTIPVVGPVRGVAGGDGSDGALSVSIYGARLDFDVAFDLSVIPIPVQELRTSLDLNDPAETSVTSYFDSNGSAATIDGMPDTVPTTPRLTWYQASGTAGGMVVAIPTLVTNGTVSNYYLDDGTIDPADTGDQRSYADTGLHLANPSGVIQFQLVTGILPPGTVGNVGASFYERVTNPLTVNTTLQIFGQAGLYLPIMFGPTP